MDESFRFADILFTALTLAIVYLILYFVKKGKKKDEGNG